MKKLRIYKKEDP